MEEDSYPSNISARDYWTVFDDNVKTEAEEYI